MYLSTYREISLQRGTTINILKKVDEHWLLGEQDGRRGLFPESYVRVSSYSCVCTLLMSNCCLHAKKCTDDNIYLKNVPICVRSVNLFSYEWRIKDVWGPHSFFAPSHNFAITLYTIVLVIWLNYATNDRNGHVMRSTHNDHLYWSTDHDWLTHHDHVLISMHSDWSTSDSYPWSSANDWSTCNDHCS